MGCQLVNQIDDQSCTQRLAFARAFTLLQRESGTRSSAKRRPKSDRKHAPRVTQSSEKVTKMRKSDGTPYTDLLCVTLIFLPGSHNMATRSVAKGSLCQRGRN